MRKVCVVVTARPSYSRVKSAMTAIRQHPDLELQTVVAASALLDRYGNVSEVMANDGFEINAEIPMVLEGDGRTVMAQTTGMGMIQLATTFANLEPDMVVTIADRYETLATAVAASFMGIPLVHIQGGEVTGSIDERVRHAVTKLSDLHLVASKGSAKRVLQLGEDPRAIFVTGCPSIDLALEAADCVNLDYDPNYDFGGVGPIIDISEGYSIVMLHPVTTEQELARRQVEIVLEAVLSTRSPTFWFWPNVDAGSDGTSRGIRHFREKFPEAPIRFLKNLPPEPFLQLCARASVLIGNSSVAIRECAYLGVPAVNIGSRQSGRDRGSNVYDVDFEVGQISEAITTQMRSGRRRPDYLYERGDAGSKIAEVLAKYQFSKEKRLRY